MIIAASEICSSCTPNSGTIASEPTMTNGIAAAITDAERRPTIRNTTTTTITTAPMTLPTKSLILRTTFSDWSETMPIPRSGGKIFRSSWSSWMSCLASSQIVTMLLPAFIENATITQGYVPVASV